MPAKKSLHKKRINAEKFKNQAFFHRFFWQLFPVKLKKRVKLDQEAKHLPFYMMGKPLLPLD